LYACIVTYDIVHRYQFCPAGDQVHKILNNNNNNNNDMVARRWPRLISASSRPGEKSPDSRRRRRLSAATRIRVGQIVWEKSMQRAIRYLSSTNIELSKNHSWFWRFCQYRFNRATTKTLRKIGHRPARKHIYVKKVPCYNIDICLLWSKLKNRRYIECFDIVENVCYILLEFNLI